MAATNLPWSDAIRERFKFETPSEFRALEARGLFHWSEKAREAELTTPGDHYLWFHEMEWYQPGELRKFEFESYHKNGFIPFAHAGNGDLWCWYPERAEGGRVPVLLCPHDLNVADLYARDFASALYRHALQFCAETADDDPDETSAMLKRYAVDLGSIWRPAWQKQIKKFAAKPIDEDDYQEIVEKEFGEPWSGSMQVKWMTDGDEIEPEPNAEPGKSGEATKESNRPFKARDAKDQFLARLSARGQKPASLRPADGIEAMLAFYADQRADDCDLDSGGDTLMVRWSPGKTFDIAIARQMISEESMKMHGLLLEFQFELTPELKKFRYTSETCDAPADLPKFRKMLGSSSAYKTLANQTPKKVKFDLL